MENKEKKIIIIAYNYLGHYGPQLLMLAIVQKANDVHTLGLSDPEWISVLKAPEHYIYFHECL